MQKNDKKKAALSEYREALKELEYWVDTLARMDHGGQQAQTFTARIRESTKARSPEMKTIERSMAEENKRRATAKAQDARERVMALIDTVRDADQRILLMRRYIDGMTWDDIAEAFGRSRTWATNTHGTAVKAVAEPVEKTVKKC